MEQNGAMICGPPSNIKDKPMKTHCQYVLRQHFEQDILLFHFTPGEEDVYLASDKRSHGRRSAIRMRMEAHP